MAWTAADIADLSGKGAIVTGASNGLGLLAAGELARRGAKVVFAVRDVGKGEAAATRVRSAAPKAEIVVSRLDLSDLSSVREFAAEIPEIFPHGLDILMNNAGVMALPKRASADGYELQFATNHLGHFALTGLLMPSLLLRRSPRVVTVSSSLHSRGRIDFNDLNGNKRYSPFDAYSQSKLANLLFTYELQRRAAATSLLSLAAHPGYTATGLQEAGPRMTGSAARGLMMRVANTVMAQRPEMGVLPQLYAATAPGVPAAGFFGPDGRGELRGYPKLVASSPASHDEAVARRLWDESEQMTGVRYSFAA
ncbi:oxidoreductase [Herbidospora mongoliensis]|uniref:oxidoreductase n=1 Tax=Herbidospora mongoliensis TaxID=688067 RepID=UPI0008349CAD|nr:oxidoreductase [Herbidospora mongoliensis]